MARVFTSVIQGGDLTEKFNAQAYSIKGPKPQNILINLLDWKFLVSPKKVSDEA